MIVFAIHFNVITSRDTADLCITGFLQVIIFIFIINQSPSYTKSERMSSDVFYSDVSAISVIATSP